jgi:hypothetical protein
VKSKRERQWWLCDRLVEHLDGILDNPKSWPKMTFSQQERMSAEIADMKASMKCGRALFRKPLNPDDAPDGP